MFERNEFEIEEVRNWPKDVVGDHHVLKVFTNRLDSLVMVPVLINLQSALKKHTNNKQLSKEQMSLDQQAL